jgi:hypothetical protein
MGGVRDECVGDKDVATGCGAPDDLVAILAAVLAERYSDDAVRLVDEQIAAAEGTMRTVWSAVRPPLWQYRSPSIRQRHSHDGFP